MTRNEVQEFVRRLASPPTSIVFDVGLSDQEVQAVENCFNFSIPPDLREFLQFALPVREKPRPIFPDYPRPPGYPGEGIGFPNWRDLNTNLQFQIDAPIDGVLFDVRMTDIWPASWGPRPLSEDEAVAIANTQLVAAPKLIPIHGHTFICEEPRSVGNPIISVSQTDIIYLASDLASYFECTYFGMPYKGIGARIPFWSDIMIAHWGESASSMFS